VQKQTNHENEEAEMSKELCYIIDSNNQPLSPTNYNKGWVLVRKKKAKLISRLPFVVQLNKQVETDDNWCILGIDSGSKYTGFAIIEECKIKNKILFKGTLEHRLDVKKKMELRRGERKYRRMHKRYRKQRFNNRASSRRIGRLPNSIKCNKDEILRTINKLSKFLRISEVIIEDVKIDIRKLIDGKVYKWQYQKSNRLDENLRIATIMRDDYTCKLCNAQNIKLEVHHIKARKYGGANTLSNLIALCSKCHSKITGKEKEYEELLYGKIKGKNINSSDAQRVMQGKKYLQNEILKKYPLSLTYGSDTANKRIDWGISKSHSNDACIIANLKILEKDCDVKDWIIKPIRSKKKNKVEGIDKFKHRDIITYTKRNGEKYIGYIISIDLIRNTISFTDFYGKIFRRYGIKSCKLIQRPKNIMLA
jgi:5-methylcytosine-specific restriction endonuclease McrA